MKSKLANRKAAGMQQTLLAGLVVRSMIFMFAPGVSGAVIYSGAMRESRLHYNLDQASRRNDQGITATNSAVRNQGGLRALGVKLVDRYLSRCCLSTSFVIDV